MSRSAILCITLALAGCSDYNLQAVDAEEPDAESNADEPEATPELLEEPQDDESEPDAEDSTPTEEPDGTYPPDPDCGFTVENWYLLPEGGGPQTSFVKSYPTIELVGDQPGEDVEMIDPGDPLVMSVTITAHPCGDIELVRVDTTIQEVSLAWLLQVMTAPAQMNATDGWQFESVPATGVGVSPGSDELHFVWTDGSTYPLGLDNAGEMDTVLVPAGESVTMTFAFTATQGAAPGTVVDLFLDGINWVDVETAQIVRFWGPGKIVEFE